MSSKKLIFVQNFFAKDAFSPSPWNVSSLDGSPLKSASHWKYFLKKYIYIYVLIIYIRTLSSSLTIKALGAIGVDEVYPLLNYWVFHKNGLFRFPNRRFWNSYNLFLLLVKYKGIHVKGSGDVFSAFVISTIYKAYYIKLIFLYYLSTIL